MDFLKKEVFLSAVKKNVVPELEKNEGKRKKIIIFGVILPLIWVIVTIPVLFIFVDAFPISLPLTSTKLRILLKVILILLPAAGGRIAVVRLLNSYKSKYMPYLLQCFGNLSTKDTLDDDLILKSGLLFPINEKNRIFQTSDIISGEFNNISFGIKECVISSPSVTGDAKGKMAKGVFIGIPMNREIKSHSIIINSSIDTAKISSLKKTTIEDPLFMKEFKIYTDNQIEIRKILSPAFIEKLYEMKKIFKNYRIDFCFMANHVLFVIRSSHNFFEPFSIFSKPDSMKNFSTFYDEIKVIYNMMQVLNIN